MNKLKLYIIILLYWVFIMGLSSWFALANVTGFIELADIDLSAIQNPVIKYWASPFQMLEATLFGLLFGLLFIGANEISEKLLVEKYSFGKVILIKSAVYLGGFLLSTITVYLIMSQFDFFPKNAIREMSQFKLVYWIIIFALIFLGFQTLLVNFVIQTIKKFGLNNLINFISGKYQHPVVEDRIFLFMDLKSSTTYAEMLGNIKYSQLIKDCFDDINLLVDKYKAEIYQYVGDEVVLTWRTDRVIITLEYISIFYAFKEALEKRRNHYMKKYGVVPEFKAGVHGGLVTVAEIGNIKRDIAYHGDVLNTASRIQSICNDYGEHFLISGELVKRTRALNGYKCTSIGQIQLKGKLSSIDVCSVKK
ncbi:adenylate/guanylate cyclase domain-containing protein [Fulvivirga ulvae]|uniref:adenylate/guanylate cyclase domain-containing protein n=1 Tax=Fulvivirga ulvae TaxID=2904245 RepID=UPI001F3AAD4C|nr:adenylate/guanylate cyclase domain-containing protein [Fulvivirga ulvae]UII34076.1 adenylate/guanylate cyclase domain-containing protein [Fulvivirga ulvae]